MNKEIAVAAFGLMLSGPVLAIPDHVYDYTTDGSTLTTNQSAAGSQLTDGQVVALTLHALGNDHWTSNLGDTPWLPVAMAESGNRIGDLTWTFYFDGVAVDSGSYTGQSSQHVHITQPMGPIGANILFDEVHWDFTQSSYTPDGVDTTNTLGDLFFGAQAFGSGGLGATYVVVPDDAAAPVPGTLALFGLALAGFGLSRRKRGS